MTTTTTQYTQHGNTVDVDLNGNSGIPTTKSGKPQVLRSHAVYLDGEITHRLFTQGQVKEIKDTGQWITKNDRDWASRHNPKPWILVDPLEMIEILRNEK